MIENICSVYIPRLARVNSSEQVWSTMSGGRAHPLEAEGAEVVGHAASGPRLDAKILSYKCHIGYVGTSLKY